MKEINVNFGQFEYSFGKLCRIETIGYQKVTRENIPDSELGRFMNAVDIMTSVLGEALDNANEQNSKVIEAELMLLNDMEFCGAIRKLIEEGDMTASEAVRFIGQKNAEILLAGADEYISERAQDIRGITYGLIDILNGKSDKGEEQLSEPVIIVAEELTPYDMARVNQENILGIISRNGSRLCHASVMAGNLGIPYVYGVEPDIEEIMLSQCAVMDGEEGKLILCDEDELEHLVSSADRHSSGTETERVAEGVLNTKTRIYLNISGCESIQKLVSSGADGVGLLRSEFMFLNNENPPTEEEQYEAYAAILQAMGDKTVVIRVMDMGGDKCVPWIEQTPETNPAMGLKGIRLLLKRRNILDTQLRALLRASDYGNLKLLFPMISTEYEMPEIRKIIEGIADTLRAEGIEVKIPPVGAEIETPAAAVISDIIAKQSDFFCIGTNDMMQYAIAVDRENSALDYLYDAGNESIIRLVRMTVSAAHENGIEVSVCGEMASDPEIIPKLIDAGIDVLSVSLERVDRTRLIVRAKEDKKDA